MHGEAVAEACRVGHVNLGIFPRKFSRKVVSYCRRLTRIFTENKFDDFAWRYVSSDQDFNVRKFIRSYIVRWALRVWQAKPLLYNSKLYVIYGMVLFSLDLEWPLKASRRLSASAELQVQSVKRAGNRSRIVRLLRNSEIRRVGLRQKN